MKQQQYNTALYMRLSRDDELEGESASISTQKQILRDYANEQGFLVVDEYVDDGFSGTNFERPSFKRMIEDIEDGKINCVVTKDDCVILELNSESPENTGLCDVSSVF
ncbi:recombinase [bacterium 1XD42-94]|nr:recombinase [bacterium 1XD42-76]NBK04590.1 recombinase [bacterium 1XD42-94]